MGAPPPSFVYTWARIERGLSGDCAQARVWWFQRGLQPLLALAPIRGLDTWPLSASETLAGFWASERLLPLGVSLSARGDPGGMDSVETPISGSPGISALAS